MWKTKYRIRIIDNAHKQTFYILEYRILWFWWKKDPFKHKFRIYDNAVEWVKCRNGILLYII